MFRALRILTRILALVVLIGLLGFAWLVWQVESYGREDHARAADAIVVLGARVEANGQPGPDLLSRTEHAITLWREGLAPQVICTGGFKNEPLSAAAVCRRTATAMGVPATRIWLADGSQNTVEDARQAAAVMAGHGWRSAILVSHPLHLYRAQWLFSRAGVDAVTSPTSTQTDRIALPYRLWYGVREAGAILVTNLYTRGWLPVRLTETLQGRGYDVPGVIRHASDVIRHASDVTRPGALVVPPRNRRA